MQQMVRDIPPGWVVATLGDIATPSPERVSPADVSPPTPYVGLEHIEAHTMQLLGRGSILGVRSSSVRFSAGDVLYARMRPYLNKVWVADFDGVCSAEFLVFRKHRAINSHFLAAVLNAEEFVDFANSRVSGERPRVKFSQLASFPIMLPPRVEQDLIVAKLHSVFARASRARKASNRALDRIKNYVTSVIDAGTAGDFTRDWRDTHDSSTSHSLAKMSSVVRAAHQSASEKERPRRRTPATNTAQQSLHQGPTSHGRNNLPKLPKGWLWISWTEPWPRSKRSAIPQ
jgi:type I restriction enzyme S subunit